MKPYRFQTVAAAGAMLAMLACGGGGGGGGFVAGGGIGGTGALSAGQITAKGSITVNGVKYATDDARILVDGTAASDDRLLRVGMIVEVEGRIDVGGTSGTARVVRFDDSVEGPIAAGGIDAAAGTVDVMGQLVLVDDRTIYDDGSIAPPNLTGLADGDVIQVSGQIDEAGNIRATHIEKKLPGGVYEVTGFASGVGATAFFINGLEVDFGTVPAVLDGFGPGGPGDGDFVEVKGSVFDPVAVKLTAVRVENKARAPGEDLTAAVEGYIDALTVAGFSLVLPSGQIEVVVDGGTAYSGGIRADLAVGVKVQAEGVISGGRLLADKVAFKDNIRVEVAADDGDGATLTVTLRRLSALPVKVDGRTRLDDKRSPPSGAGNLADFLDSIDGDEDLKIRARQTAGGLLAVELEVDDDRSGGDLDDVDLRGPADAAPLGTVTLSVLGITVNTAGVSEANFEDIDGNPIGRTAFFSRVRAGTPLDVKGVLSADNRIAAEEMELEDD